MKLYIFLKKEREKFGSFYKQNIFLERIGGFYQNKTEYLLREIKYLRERISSQERERVGGCYKNKK